MTLLQVQPLLESWQPASWEEFVRLADEARSDRLKCYYYDGKMRFEPIATSVDHARDHVLILFAVSLFAMNQNIQVNGYDCCSYRQIGSHEFQPDLSYYAEEMTRAIPWGTGVINLDRFPIPNLVVEISDTSLSDDLGTKRLQYEDLRIPEYWIVNVQAMQVLGFSIAADGTTKRIQESQVFPGLQLEILEQALLRSRGESQSATSAWLMQQFQR